MKERNLCTIEQALKLLRLGLIMKGCWYFTIETGECKEKTFGEVGDDQELQYAGGEIADAWTAQELKIMIGDRFEHPQMSKPKPVKGKFSIELKGSLVWEVYYLQRMKSFKNEAEACGDFLISLLENNIIGVEEVNKRIDMHLVLGGG